MEKDLIKKSCSCHTQLILPKSSKTLGNGGCSSYDSLIG
jgi:hypothetical protein